MIQRKGIRRTKDSPDSGPNELIVRNLPGHRVRGVLLSGLFGIVLWCNPLSSYEGHISFVRLPELSVTDFPIKHRLPLVISGVGLVCTSLNSVVWMKVLHSMQSLLDHKTLHIKRGLQAHLFLSIVAATFYFWSYTFDRQILYKMPDGGTYLIMRSVMWTVSTPVQLYIHGISFAAEHASMNLIFASSILMQVFGILTHVFTWRTLIWLSWILSCLAFVAMFYYIFQMPLRRETKKAARVFQMVNLCVWTVYPFIHFGRTVEWISPWMEQIMLYSIFDFTTKAITCSSTIVSHLLLTLASIDGTMQLATAANDFCVVVDDNFLLLDTVWDSASVSQYFDSDIPDWSLLQRCVDKEHADRLKSAAQAADSEHFRSSASKCVVAFKLQGGMGNVLTECHVSKKVKGHRVIGVAVTSVSGSGLTGNPAQDFAPASAALSTPSISRYPPTLRGSERAHEEGPFQEGDAVQSSAKGSQPSGDGSELSSSFGYSLCSSHVSAKAIAEAKHRSAAAQANDCPSQQGPSGSGSASSTSRSAAGVLSIIEAAAISRFCAQCGADHIEKHDEETQTAGTQALPPLGPARYFVDLGSKRRFVKKCAVTPKETLYQMVLNSITQMNPRGKGCCFKHIGLAIMQRSIKELVADGCNTRLKPNEDWQCPDCCALHYEGGSDYEDDNDDSVGERTCPVCSWMGIPTEIAVAVQQEDQTDSSEHTYDENALLVD